MKSLITDLTQIEQLATARHDEFEVLRYMLEINADVSDATLDAWVDEVAQPIIDAIDCRDCANCCRVLDVYVTEDDTKRLEPVVDVPLDAIIEHKSAKAVGEWGQLKTTPCSFLKDNLCMIYAQRPETCRTYPALTSDFRWTLADTIAGASICPIIYNVLDVVIEQLDSLYAINQT